MMILEANGYGKIVVALSDDSEIEITIVELDGHKSKVIMCAGEGVSVQRIYTVKID